MAIKAVTTTLVAATVAKIAGSLSGTVTMPISVIIWNATGATLYLGGADVTDSGATQGLPVANASFSPSFDLVAGDDLYAYSTAGGSITALKTRH